MVIITLCIAYYTADIHFIPIGYLKIADLPVFNMLLDSVKVQKYWHRNVLKIPKVKVVKCLKIADLQAHNASRCDAL